jgi:hypothetical protein
MKTILKSSLYFYLAFLIGLLPFFGCGGDDDVTPSEGFRTPSEEFGTSSEEFRTSSEGFRFPSGEFKFPPGASGPLWKLSDAYIAELLKLDIPSNWAWMDIDKETYNKYYHAQLLKQFGAIPEVRYLIAYSLHPGDKTREQIIAKSEVHYRLFPNEETLKSLQQTIALPDFTNPGPAETEDEWIQRDPEGYYEYLLEVFIKDYGDIPEVYTFARLTLKIKQYKNLTAAEWQAYKDASEYLRDLDAQREAE